MSRFEVDKWYKSKATHRYYQCVFSQGGMVHVRQAGSRGHISEEFIELDMLEPASIVPCFTDAKVGDECWSYYFEKGTIKEKGKRTYDLLVKQQDGSRHETCDYDGMTGSSDGHPTLFNTFDQFMAYWAEQALKVHDKSRGWGPTIFNPSFSDTR